MFVSRANPYAWTVAFACMMIGLTGCSAWREVRIANLSPDGRTLTVNVIFGKPDLNGRHCERVTSTELSESPSRVIIGVQVDDSCRRSWPWEGKLRSNAGYVHPVQLRLKGPLGDRSVYSNTDHQRVRIIRENP